MKIQVLDKGYVELIDTLPTRHDAECDGDCNPNNLDYRIVEAARVSYKNGRKSPEADKKLIRYLWTNHHTSPFEQVEFQFLVKIPIVVERQWFRHRMAEYNLQSGRYTEYEDEFYIPSEWRLQDSKNKQGSNGIADENDFLWLNGNLEGTIQESMYRYREALKMGVSKEMARFFLPAFLLYSTGMVKMNLHSLINFLFRRDDDHAQYEIREYAKAIKSILKETMPWTYEVIFGE